MSLIMKDQAKRQLMLDEFDKHWAEEEKISIYKTVFFAFFLTAFLVLLLFFIPVEASTVWQEVSDQSLVDQWGNE